MTQIAAPEIAARPPPSGMSADGVDLTVCDREPIHIPGSIQPCGLLLVADAASLEVIGGAGDLEARLRPDWLGAALGDLLGASAEAALRRAPATGPTLLAPIQGMRETLEACAHLQDGRWLVQLEPAADARHDAAWLLSWLDRSGAAFETAADLKQLCERAVGIFREMTGFDRVMVYRFLDDDAGVVVAEACATGEPRFLNHHFPASDIPKQARALYIRNRVRVIPDVRYVAQPIRPPQAGLADVDLSDVDVRSVSPIHLQYLENMGVAASASISIVKDGVLWGLIACHGDRPRSLAYSERRACQVVAGGLARQIRAKEEAEGYRERLRLRGAEDGVLARLAATGDLEEVVEQVGVDLQRMMAADGFAAVQGGALHMVGRCPDRSDVWEVAAWVRAQNAAMPIHTNSLSERLKAARDYAEHASGLLAVTVSVEEPAILMWFRAERLEVVNWAGNPHKSAAAGPGEMLTPRASFAAWSEEVSGRSAPWSLPEIESAQRLTRVILESRQTRRIRDLNQELAASLADKDRLLAQKDYLIREVNHRIQNSLQLVSAFLSLQSKSQNEDIVTRHLNEAQRRISAVALVHRRLYGDDNVEVIDLARYLEDLVDDIKTSLGPEWADKISLDLAPIMIPADDAVNVGLILTELVINANKYAYGGAPGPLTLSLEQHRNRYRLIVADSGSGKSGSREGFGTRMLTAMVRQLGGAMEELDNKPGLRAVVTAPIQRRPSDHGSRPGAQ